MVTANDIMRHLGNVRVTLCAHLLVGYPSATDLQEFPTAIESQAPYLAANLRHLLCVSAIAPGVCALSRTGACTSAHTRPIHSQRHLVSRRIMAATHMSHSFNALARHLRCEWRFNVGIELWLVGGHCNLSWNFLGMKCHVVYVLIGLFISVCWLKWYGDAIACQERGSVPAGIENFSIKINPIFSPVFCNNRVVFNAIHHIFFVLLEWTKIN